MPIVAVCGQCSKRYTLDDKFAGRKVKCRTCNSQFEVPTEDPTMVSADVGAAPDPALQTMGEDVLEMKTEFRQRAAARTVAESREEAAVEEEEPTRATSRLERGKGRGTEKRGRSRYKRKSRWKLKLFVGLVVLVGLAIGAGMLFAPKNMAHKWDRTKAFWGGDFVTYLGDIFSLDMSLEKSGDAEADPEDEPKETGPPAGSAAVLRGVITEVEPGIAGGDPKACTVTTADGNTYRLMLPEASSELADIASALEEGEDGPSIEASGVLAENGMDANKLTQVDADGFEVVEADAIADKPGLEVTPPEGSGDDPSDEGDASDEGDDAGEDAGEDEADEGSAEEPDDG